MGCYEAKEKEMIYSVINTDARRQLIPLIHSVDPHAFINVVKTEELAGRFHDIPNDLQRLLVFPYTLLLFFSVRQD